MDVIDGVAPLVQIECFTCKVSKSFKYIENKKLKLYTTCSNCNNLPTSYTWQIQGSKDIEKTFPGHVLSVLVLKKYELAANQSYEIKVTAKIKG